MDPRTPRHFRPPQEEIPRITCTSDARYDETIYCGIRCIKVRLWSSFTSTRLQWRLASMCLHLEIIQRDGKELRNLRQGTPSYHSGVDRLETLFSWLPTCGDSSFRSPQLNLFPTNPKTQPPTSSMEPILIRL